MPAAVRTTLCVFALVIAGCSGAGNQDLFDESATGNDSSSVHPSPSTPTTPGPSDTTTPTSPPTTTPGPTPDPTPEPKPEACTREIEPNDSMGRATSFATSFCGKIDSAGDIDYASFVVPKNAKAVTVKHDETGGTLSYRYFLEGGPVLTLGDQLEPIPGAKYTIQVRQASGGNNKPSYELDVFFE